MPAESPGVRATLRREIRTLYGVHLSYLQHAVRHLRPLRTMNGGLALPSGGGRAHSRFAACLRRGGFRRLWRRITLAAPDMPPHGITRNSTPATAIFHCRVPLAGY